MRLRWIMRRLLLSLMRLLLLHLVYILVLNSTTTSLHMHVFCYLGLGLEVYFSFFFFFAFYITNTLHLRYFKNRHLSCRPANVIDMRNIGVATPTLEEWWTNIHIGRWSAKEYLEDLHTRGSFSLMYTHSHHHIRMCKFVYRCFGGEICPLLFKYSFTGMVVL